MKKRYVLAALVGISIFLKFAVFAQTAGGATVSPTGAALGPGGTTGPMGSSGATVVGTGGAIVLTPEQKYERDIVGRHKRFVSDVFGESGTIEKLQKGWKEVINDLIKQLTEARNKMTTLPTNRIYQDMIKYTTAEYQKKEQAIKNFKPLEMPKAPWEK